MDTISEEQLVANRENAKLGGVKTEEGKAISRYNALKHGLLSKEVLLTGEDEEALVELGKRLREELKAASTIEFLLVDRITANTWRLRRVLEIEKNTMEWEKSHTENEQDFSFGLNEETTKEQKERKKFTDMIENDKIEHILRYETAIERSIYKAIHELQRIQSARRGEKPIIPIAIDLDITKDD